MNGSPASTSAVEPSPEEAAVERHLESCDSELLAAFRDSLPGARAAVLHRLLQCIVRENIAGWRERAVDQAGALLIRLPRGGELQAPVVRRLSLDRRDFGSPVVVRSGGGERALIRAGDLLDLFDAEQSAADSGERSRRERFRFELDNSTANLALATAAFARRRDAIAQSARQAHCTTAVEWAEQLSRTDPAFSPLVFFEQCVVEGHPLHPGAKLKAGMTPADVLQFSPELGAVFGARIAAVAKSHCRIAAYGNGGPAEVLRHEYSTQAARIDRYLVQRDLQPLDYEWVPMHPWQFANVLPEMFAAEIACGAVVPIADVEIPAAPLMAVRSLAPVGPGSRERHHWKTAINVQTTGAVRTVSPQAAENGPMLAEVLGEVRRRERHFDDRLVVLLEDAGVHFATSDADVPDERRELLGKNLAVILRENPEAFVQAGEIAMPASALLAESPLGGGPIVGELVAQYARRLSCEPAAAVVPFLAEYAATSVSGMLTLLSSYGIALEGHLQNCVMVFRDAVPVRMLVRDMGGVRIWPPRLERHGLQVRFQPGSATLALDEEDLRNKVGYAFLQNHWGELIACLVRTFGVVERDAWRVLATAGAAIFRNLAADPLVAESARGDASFFFRSHLALKALTTMRLQGAVTNYSFSEVSNPLAEFAGTMNIEI